METLKKIVLYIGGLFLIAIGINISKIARLGISPVSSIPRAAELIWGMTLGTATIVLQFLLIFLQFLLLRKRFRPVELVQVIVGLAFGYIVDLTGTDPNAFGHLLSGFPVPQTYVLRLVYVIASVILIGIGVYIYIKPGWIPMAADGLSKAIVQRTGKPFGSCKTIVDTCLVLTALVLQVVFLGGMSSFTGDKAVVREGTIFAAVFAGQVVKLCAKISEKRKKSRK